MGATCLVHWKDANGQQSLTLLSERLLKQFHASSIGRWNIIWKVYRDTSPVSKSGTGKMLHVVQVQGGATASGIPAGSQAANLSSGGILAGGNISISGAGAGVSGMGASGGMTSSGMVGSSGMSVNTGLGGPSKAGLGILPSGGGPAGSGAAGSGVGGAGGSASAQMAADTYNSTAWCLIDDGAVGAPPNSVSSTAPSTVNTPMSSTGAEGATTPKRKAVLVEVEKDIEALIVKLKNLWVSRQHAQVEGYVYDLGDFIVRAGNIMVASSSYKGMLIEVFLKALCQQLDIHSAI
ncbi:hypothetical protein BGX27_006929 [Mortierella sp. AM989]|nr:hypothetical protein BGX27_006929 [Mortierella sp. AM989]